MPYLSIRARTAGYTTVVVSACSTIAGPVSSIPGFRASLAYTGLQGYRDLLQ